MGQDPHVDFPLAVGAPRVSPDGKYLAYIAGGRASTGDDWVLENFLPKAGAEAKPVK